MIVGAIIQVSSSQWGRRANDDFSNPSDPLLAPNSRPLHQISAPSLAVVSSVVSETVCTLLLSQCGRVNARLPTSEVCS